MHSCTTRIARRCISASPLLWRRFAPPHARPDFIGYFSHRPAWHGFRYSLSVVTIASTMKIAIPLCRQRIAPLFEVAETFVLINPGDSDSEPTICETRRLLTGDKCRQLHAEGTRILLCGALSRRWQDYLHQQGIEVHAFLAGDTQEVLHAYLQDGARGLERYAMPGRKENRGGRQQRRPGQGRRNAFNCHQFWKE